MRTTEHKDLKQSAFLDLNCFCESGPYSGCYSGSSVEMREKRFHSIFNKGEKEFMLHTTLTGAQLVQRQVTPCTHLYS